MCINGITDATKLLLLKNFNDIGTQDGQDAYLSALITSRPSKRRRSQGGVYCKLHKICLYAYLF